MENFEFMDETLDFVCNALLREIFEHNHTTGAIMKKLGELRNQFGENHVHENIFMFKMLAAFAKNSATICPQSAKPDIHHILREYIDTSRDREIAQCFADEEKLAAQLKKDEELALRLQEEDALLK